MIPDDLRAPGTDDEPWSVPPSDPDDSDRLWYAFLAIVVLALVAVALVRWR